MKKYEIRVAVCVLLLLLLLGAGEGGAQSTSADAIALRVIPNPKHLSAERWYLDQGFSGSPQSITVDGYEAVRDGRTVYVNVGNVDSGTLYTNIYLISYNQQAESETVDIFGQMLRNWSFNANIDTSGWCRADGRICYTDEDCGIGDFCDSLKSRVTRDTLRLSHIGDTKDLLAGYFEANGYYPLLDAGSYLKHKSLSVWPSWQDELSAQLDTRLAVDPVNNMGDCPGHNEDTCWNEESQDFAFGWGSFPDTPALNDNSLVYIYTTNGRTTGSDSLVCGVLESGLSVYGNPVCTVGVCIDFDRDGYGVFDSGLCPNPGVDCNDSDPAINISGGGEICDNGLDDDCDGAVDCADGDCAAVCGGALCVPNGCGGGCPSGCSGAEDPDCNGCMDGDGCCPTGCTPATDADCAPVCAPDGCNDFCPPGCSFAEDPDCGCLADAGNCCPASCGGSDPDCTSLCNDMDGDGYDTCDPSEPGDTDGLEADCNDGLADVHPGYWPEECDSTDHDCDGFAANGLDPVTCSWACAAAGYVWTGNSGVLDCCGNDAGEGGFSGYGPYQAHEDAPPLDLCSDSTDNDCNGFTDSSGGDPNCGGACAGTSEDNFIGPMPSDCDQCDNPGDQEGDQSSVLNQWTSAYPSNPGLADQCDRDCNALLAATVHFDDYDGPVEARCDGIDNNCDGNVDEGCDDDGDGYCNQAMQLYGNNSMCTNTVFTGDGMYGNDCNDTEPLIYWGAPETCGDGIDQDCDGSDDVCAPLCTDGDGDGFFIEGGACGEIDCDDTLAYVFPGNPNLTCDGRDNDCSGGPDGVDIDEGCDDDGDGYCDAGMELYNTPLAVCPASTALPGPIGDDCNDTDSAYNPASEISCGQGVCANTAPSCMGTTPNTCTPLPAPMTSETGFCTDSLDNDCDGLTDSADTADCDMTCTFDATLPCLLAAGSTLPGPVPPPSIPPPL